MLAVLEPYGFERHRLPRRNRAPASSGVVALQYDAAGPADDPDRFADGVHAAPVENRRRFLRHARGDHRPTGPSARTTHYHATVGHRPAGPVAAELETPHGPGTERSGGNGRDAAIEQQCGRAAAARDDARLGPAKESRMPRGADGPS